MLFNNFHVKIALRNFMRQKYYTLINISGLAMGLTCCLLIYLFVQDELSYDQHHVKHDEIYRVIREIRTPGVGNEYTDLTPGELAPSLEANFPEVEYAIRTYFRESDAWIRYKDKIYRQRFCVTDPDIFNVLSLPLVHGDPETVFNELNSVIITQSIARKYFGDENPIGKTIVVEDQRKVGGDYIVTGVLKDAPANTHLQIEFLTTTIRTEFVKSIWDSSRLNSTWSGRIQTYVLLGKGQEPTELEQKIESLVAKEAGDQPVRVSYHLQPLSRVHLYSKADYGIFGTGDITHIILFSTISIFILLIGCINFMNLSTARSAYRAHEVSMRKIVGAQRHQLILHFLGESVFLSIIASILALSCVEMALPYVNAFTGKHIILNQSDVLLTICVALGAGILAGSYPAFFLSAFQPIQSLQRRSKTDPRGIILRKILVVFQFGISIVLIIGILTIYNQLKYVQNKNLGFDKDLIITMHLFYENYALIPQYETVKQAFRAHSNIIAASASEAIPSIPYNSSLILPEDNSQSNLRMRRLCVDEDYVDVYGVEIISGQPLSPIAASDNAQFEFLINETAVKQLGWDTPVGRQLKLGWRGYQGTVVGVIKDYNFESLYEKIEPLFLIKEPTSFRWLSLRIRPQNIPETLSFIESTWERFLPNRPFQFSFLDERLNQLYLSEMRLSQLLHFFFALALAISCLGLLGLSAFAAEQRTKEIGIRKVLGASVFSVMSLLSTEYLKLLAIATLLAWPVAFYVMNDWLQEFAYRDNLKIETFIAGSGVVIAIALITVVYQSLRAAYLNPVDALKSE